MSVTRINTGKQLTGFRSRRSHTETKPNRGTVTSYVGSGGLTSGARTQRMAINRLSYQKPTGSCIVSVFSFSHAAIIATGMCLVVF